MMNAESVSANSNTFSFCDIFKETDKNKYSLKLDFFKKMKVLYKFTFPPIFSRKQSELIFFAT